MSPTVPATAATLTPPQAVYLMAATAVAVAPPPPMYPHTPPPSMLSILSNSRVFIIDLTFYLSVRFFANLFDEYREIFKCK
jgi:hypothetical protein